MERDATLSEGSTLGPYRVVRRVGRGTFSEVYEALKHPLNRRVALKIMRADHAEQPEAVARFDREARLAASVDHPHLVKVLESGAFDGVRVHEMEFLDGPTLAAVMRAHGALPLAAACDVMIPLVSAVAALHDLGFVHRDLKPSNVILAERRKGISEPVLIDLGIVKAPQGPSEASLTRTTALLGSPGYMSPEQARESRNLDARSDQFSLAVVFWEMLTGRRLFEGEVLYKVLQKVAEAPITPPAALRPDLPAPLSDAVMRALERDPDHRFPHVRALGAALLPFASPAVRDRFVGELAAPAVPAMRSFADAEESTLVNVRPVSTPAAVIPMVSASLPLAQSSLPLAAMLDSSTLPPGAVSQETLSPRDVAVRTGAHALPLSRGAAVAFGVVFVVAAVALFGGTPDAPEATAPPTPLETFRVELRVIPESATISLDGREVGVGSMRWDLPRDGRAHRVRARAAGYVPREVEFTDAPPPRELVLVSSAPLGRAALPPLALPAPVAQPMVPQVLRTPDDAGPAAPR